MNNTLYVVAVVSNPAGFLSRSRLFEDFCDRMEGTIADVQLVKVELCYPTQDFVHTDDLEVFDFQLRAANPLWHKENMINVAAQLLPDDWENLAWIDADITFLNHSWVEDTVSALQQHPVVQMFAKALDLGPDGLPMKTFTGFAFKYIGNGRVVPVFDPSNSANFGGITTQGDFWHPGYAWAIRREYYEAIGGLLDFSILGSGDHLMALGMVGETQRIAGSRLSPGYLGAIKSWEAKALEHVDKNIGYVPGMIAHHYHGKKVNRGYATRNNILINHAFDPSTDLITNEDMVYELKIESDRQNHMREEIASYFEARKEDD